VAIKEYQGTPNRPGRKGYVTTTFTGADVRKARGMLDKQAKESAAKIAAEKAATWTHPVRNYAGSVKHVNERSAQQITAMQRANRRLYPKGPPASRSTFQMGAYIRNGRVIRDGEEE